ncbi:MAG: hypothetical protein D6772_11970 [Bacteroidetes bacterium]|nr:MAG: hypothetical protein D6772_11970 [Bacteroidota bacterium]
MYPFLGSDKILASDVQRGLFVLQQSFSLPNLPLPVSWGPFTATAKGDKIELNWSTYAETENKGFHVERQNQAGKFVRIGWLEPEPDQTYSFVDQAPHPARNYYRLAQEDWDGSINYSRVVSAALVARADAAIVPNPSQAGAIVTLQNEEAWNYPLRLYGPDGRCWRTYADRSQPLILPSTLPTGVYVLMDDTGWKQKLLVN